MATARGFSPVATASVSARVIADDVSGPSSAKKDRNGDPSDIRPTSDSTAPVLSRFHVPVIVAAMCDSPAACAVAAAIPCACGPAIVTAACCPAVIGPCDRAASRVISASTCASNVRARSEAVTVGSSCTANRASSSSRSISRDRTPLYASPMASVACCSLARSALRYVAIAVSTSDGMEDTRNGPGGSPGAWRRHDDRAAYVRQNPRGPTGSPLPRRGRSTSPEVESWRFC